jgi:hypothetical protein
MKRVDSACATLAHARRQDASRADAKPRLAVRKRLPGKYRQAWGLVGEQLRVWRKAGSLAALPEASQRALERVFGVDLTVPRMTGGASAAWTLGGETLDRMKAEEVDALIASLGGAAVLANLKKVHADVGAAFGMTVAVSSSPASGGVSDAHLAARAVLREYVLKVQAMVDPEVPGSDALAAELLAPLLAQSKAAKAAKPAQVKTTQAKPPVTQHTVTDASKDAAPLRPTGTG